MQDIYDWAVEAGIEEDEFTLQILSCAAAIALKHLKKTNNPDIDQVNFVVEDDKGPISILVQRLEANPNETSLHLH